MILYASHGDLGKLIIIQTNLETGWAPFDKGNFVVLFQPLCSLVCLLRFDVSSVIQRDCHVFVLCGVEPFVFNQKVLWLEAIVLKQLALLTVSALSFSCHSDRFASGLGGFFLFCILNWREGSGHKVEPWEWDQVRLEFVQVDV